MNDPIHPQMSGEYEGMQMYLPVLLSVQSIVERLDADFHDLGLNYGFIVAEIMRETLANKTKTYGIHGDGMHAAFRVQAPENRPDPIADSLVLHEAQQALVDLITDLMPSNNVETTYFYHYAHGDSFVLYVPTDPQSVSNPAIRAKLVPHAALHYLDY